LFVVVIVIVVYIIFFYSHYIPAMERKRLATGGIIDHTTHIVEKRTKLIEETAEADGWVLIKPAVATAWPVQPIQAPWAKESLRGKRTNFNTGNPNISVNTPVKTTMTIAMTISEWR